MYCVNLAVLISISIAPLAVSFVLRASTQLLAAPSVQSVLTGRSITMMTLALPALRVLQVQFGPRRLKRSSARAPSATPVKQMPTAIARLPVQAVQLGLSLGLDRQRVLCVVTLASSTPTVILPHRAQIPTSVFKRAVLATRTKTVTIRRHAHHAVRESIPPVVLVLTLYRALNAHQEVQMVMPTQQHLVSRAWPDLLHRRVTLGRVKLACPASMLLQQPQCAQTAPPALRTTTPNQIRSALDVWQDSMRRLRTKARATRVQLDELDLQTGASVRWGVRCAELDSTLRRDRAPAHSVRPGLRMRTSMPPRRAQTVW